MIREKKNLNVVTNEFTLKLAYNYIPVDTTASVVSAAAAICVGDGAVPSSLATNWKSNTNDSNDVVSAFPNWSFPWISNVCVTPATAAVSAPGVLTSAVAVDAPACGEPLATATVNGEESMCEPST